MRPSLILGTGAVVILATMASVGAARPQELQLAPEGRGQFSNPTEVPYMLGGGPQPHGFEPDLFGVFSRSIFQTDEDPNFKITIRDFSFPPDRQPHTVTLPSAALIHFFSEPGGISIGNKPTALAAQARTAVPASAPIQVINNGERDVIMRALMVETK